MEQSPLQKARLSFHKRNCMTEAYSDMYVPVMSSISFGKAFDLPIKLRLATSLRERLLKKV